MNDQSIQARLLSEVSFCPKARPTFGNQVELLIDAPQFVPPMIASLDRAKETIAFQFYGMEADTGGMPFADALIRARRRGVQVKAILDTLEIFLQTNGRFAFHPFVPRETKLERRATRRLLCELEAEGVDLFRYDWSFAFHRSHAKSLISDQNEWFLGGFNPTAHNTEWHDVCARIAGPAVNQALLQFNKSFEVSGRKGFATHSLNLEPSNGLLVALVLNDPRTGYFGVREFFTRLFETARDHIWIENGYLSDSGILDCLVQAKRRGVKDVRVIVPKASNHWYVDWAFRKQVSRLLNSGVEVFFYPSMAHSKVVCVDQVVSVGSANFVRFNMRTQSELNAAIYDPSSKLTEFLRTRLFDVDAKMSTQLTS